MEIIGDIHDITLNKGETGKIKIRTIDYKKTIVDKKEVIITKEGKIIIQ